MQLVIDPELQAIIPPLAAEEQAQLEANLLAEGRRELLVVWPGDPPVDAASGAPEVPPDHPLLAKYPPDELGERCLVCGSKRKWVWIDGRPLCRRGVIDGDHQ
jgi:hypothetical protein